MKKKLLLVLLFIGSFAHAKPFTGIFDVKLQDSPPAVENKMKNRGWKITDNENVYQSPDSNKILSFKKKNGTFAGAGVDIISFDFRDDMLYSISFYYLKNKDDIYANSVLDSVLSLVKYYDADGTTKIDENGLIAHTPNFVLIMYKYDSKTYPQALRITVPNFDTLKETVFSPEFLSDL